MGDVIWGEVLLDLGVFKTDECCCEFMEGELLRNLFNSRYLGTIVYAFWSFLFCEIVYDSIFEEKLFEMHKFVVDWIRMCF